MEVRNREEDEMQEEEEEVKKKMGDKAYFNKIMVLTVLETLRDISLRQTAEMEEGVWGRAMSIGWMGNRN